MPFANLHNFGIGTGEVGWNMQSEGLGCQGIKQDGAWYEMYCDEMNVNAISDALPAYPVSSMSPNIRRGFNPRPSSIRQLLEFIPLIRPVVISTFKCSTVHNLGERHNAFLF